MHVAGEVLEKNVLEKFPALPGQTLLVKETCTSQVFCQIYLQSVMLYFILYIYIILYVSLCLATF